MYSGQAQGMDIWCNWINTLSASMPWEHNLLISFQYKQLSIQFGLHFQGLFDTIRTPTTNLPLSDHFGVRAEILVTFCQCFIHQICITRNTLGRIVPFLDLEDIDQCVQDFCPTLWSNTYWPGIEISSPSLLECNLTTTTEIFIVNSWYQYS